jgi:hypothetical protein
MKKCSYCGADYPDDAVVCAVDHTPLDRPAEPPSEPEPPGEPKPPSREPNRPEFNFPPLSEADRQQDLVTLVSCRTLLAADMVVSRLRAAEIEAFLPDESLMQAISWNLNTFGYVRVQVAPKDYDAAKELLGGSDPAA